MKQCKTCKKWAPPENQFGEVPGIGKCKSTPQYWDAAEWSEDGLSRKLKPEFSGALVLVEDGSDFRAVLRTFPDFGCTQHDESNMI